MKMTYEIIAQTNPKLITKLKISTNYNESLDDFVRVYYSSIQIRDLLHLLLSSGLFNSKQIRMFACWCARRHWDILDNNHKDCIMIAEKYSRGEVSEDSMTLAKLNAAKNCDITQPTSKANVSARVCATIDVVQAGTRSALSSIAVNNGSADSKEVIYYLITNI